MGDGAGHRGARRASTPIPSPPARRCWSSRLCWTLRGPAPRRNAGRARHRAAAALTAVVALVVALACGCADAGPAAPAGAAYGFPIDTNTPQGLRAKQTMDMLNSDWPIGPVGVRTLAAPDKVDDIGTTLDKIWWDRPFTVTGMEIGARSRDAARADLLRRGAGHRVAHQRRRPGRPVGGVPAAADDQEVGGHRRRADQVRGALLLPGVARSTTASVRWWPAPTPTCRCRWRRSSNSMCCLPLRMRSRPARSAGTTR